MKKIMKAITVALFVVLGAMLATESAGVEEVPPIRNEEFVNTQLLAIAGDDEKEREISTDTHQQIPEAGEEWLEKLVMCESSGNPNAINEVDLDGTPSYGLLQFKPSTFELFAKAYGIKGELMDPEAQKSIVRKMMGDESVIWENQFPACVRMLGRPPKV